MVTGVDDGSKGSAGHIRLPSIMEDVYGAAVRKS